jgi:hypothetical protein
MALETNDGWAHAGDSVEDLLRELKGLLNNDRHEQVMNAFYLHLAAEQELTEKKVKI